MDSATSTVIPKNTDAPLLALVGNPNVGKSVLFNNLTGRYVVVSNYPGTTVEVSRGDAQVGGRGYEVLDTPGMYSTVPISGEEQVARRVLLERSPEVVLHVADAKNLERALPLTFQLLELGEPTVLVLNVMDEAERLGLGIDREALAGALGVPVVGAVATAKRGMKELTEAVTRTAQADRTAPQAPVRYPDAIEAAVAALSPLIPAALARRARGLSLLLLQADAEVEELLRTRHAASWPAIEAALPGARASIEGDVAFALATARHDRAHALFEAHVKVAATKKRGFAELLSELTINPLTGVPILLTVLYFGLYQFVGVFGAGTAVDFLENELFGRFIVEPLNRFLATTLPGDGWRYWTRELFGGDYGLVTLGVTYAFAIVLPIVSLFFLFFSVLEDSGYFPRLAMLTDRLFKRIGLNGRAVIPIVLGFGCVTMATMVTRIQETRRERLITTLLLAMAIPCSAQYGVITALLASQPAGVLGVSWAFLLWGGVLFAMFLATGLLASKLVKGEPGGFYMELPPLRVPSLGNVLMKTLARLKWYFLEVFPLFLLASALIWIGRITGIFDLLVAGLRPVVGLLGLPSGAAEVFLYGFFRRDFGAAGLYSLNETGALSQTQLLVSAITLTLFLPCVAQLLIMKKERGLKTAALMAVGVVTTAFIVGGLANLALGAVGFGG